MEDREHLQALIEAEERRAAEAEKRAKERAEAEARQAAEAEKRAKERAAKAKKRAQEQAEEEKKRAKEWDEREAKIQKDLSYVAASIKIHDKQIGGLHNSIGSLIEDLLTTGLEDKFSDFPYQFTVVQRNLKILDKNSREVGEVDCLLINCEYNMAVECKRHLSLNDVDHHLKRIELLREYSPLVYNKKLLGAVAGADVEQTVADYAHKNGLYVISLSGDTMDLRARPQDFKAREW